MHLRRLHVGCFGGGTGLPSLIGGLKSNPWLSVNAIVTVFDSGGSSGQLRDELGVLPPGDVLRCALALARNAREARRVLLSRLQTLEHARLRGHTGGVFNVAFSPDGARLVSASADRTLRVWDVESGKELMTLRGHDESALSVAFSPDGTRIASVSEDRTVRLWDAATGALVLTLEGFKQGTYSVAFSPDGKQLAVATLDDEAVLLDTVPLYQKRAASK